MNYLEQYYDTRISSLNETDFLKHVGHTEGGKPISEHQFAKMVSQLKSLLALKQDDRLLDLCCGNGIITQILASEVQQVVGVDFAENMVAVARKHHSMKNLSYHKQDVFKLADFDEINQQHFSKVLMHGGLQHFKMEEFESLLAAILPLVTEEFTLLFSFVPQHGYQKHFYDTKKRRFSALYYKILKRDIFGHWWDKNWVDSICRKHGLESGFSTVDQCLTASKYRFNIKISRK